MTEDPGASSRVFSPEAQGAFAGWSGDHNPIHLDPIRARRLLFGGPVVHGVHALLWALDRCWPRAAGPPFRLRARFVAPIPVDLPVALEVRSRSGGAIDLAVLARGVPALTSEAEWRGAPPGGTGGICRASPEVAVPREHSVSELRDACGSLPLKLDPEVSQRLFPTLAQEWSEADLASLAATTRLVGMECPGLHSVFAELSLARVSAPPVPDFRFRVVRFDPRFQQLRIDWEAASLQGQIQAFVRPGPTVQASMAELRSRVEATEFRGWRVLVVGGSRGLGEVCAKLLAAGGAAVHLTYCRGRVEAEAVRDEIREAGGQAVASALDVTSLGTPGAAVLDFEPDTLCYFATPYIFEGRKSVFQDGLSERFRAFYVAGFERMVRALRARGLSRVLYPSSAAVAEAPRDMAEYAAAKSAGEELCRSLREQEAGLALVAPRLPRLATDQTASLIPGGRADPVDALLPVLRELAGLGAR